MGGVSSTEENTEDGSSETGGVPALKSEITTEAPALPPVPVAQTEPGIKLKEQKYEWTERILGRGELSIVYYAIEKETNRAVAIKRVAPTQLTSKAVTRLNREVHILNILSHTIGVSDKFVGLVEGFVDHEGGMCIVMDYINGYELFDLLKKYPNGYPEKKAKKLIAQILEAVLILHVSEIAHLDLKLENIMYDCDEKIIKLIDFGFASKTSKIDVETGEKLPTMLNTFCGSLHYTAPEVVRRENFDGKAADVWSMGVVCFALLTGRFPFDAPRSGAVLQKTLQGKYTIPDNISTEGVAFLQGMLDPDPANRPTIVALLKNEWFGNNNTRHPDSTEC